MSSAEETAEEIVAGPAVTDDLHGEMRRAARPFTRTTQVLAGLVVLATVFALGVWTHAAFGSAASPAPARQVAAPNGQGQAGGPRGAAGRGTTGTIDRVEGNKVYVKSAQGGEITVSTTDETTISVTQAGKLSDLKPGSTVAVQGQAGDDGTVAARSITQEAGR
ncbi:DUF5666 domain-containing protein [Amycolatopsis decaplanina]|uniref:Uncharacterized protein n=1 Tax=Amycolatopsis decaplanina DSM 44594 TaxID=1284240 RepID=M2ZIR4_9PSEU|nr:DUF5666 domain-containing protein [Amycolatopsis decaplanina]EME60244.1 hypothetical protein H074_14497 [Amycolatopsis decaplanina DSM 44594]